MNLPFPRPAEPPIKPQYIVLFKGDDSDFQGNQSIDVVIDTKLDTTGMKAHFRFMDFVQDFDSIPENKTLRLVFPNAKTSEFPLGAADATMRLEDASGKFRTVSNRIHVVVTNSVPEAYDNEDNQSITVTVKGTVTWDMIEDKPDIPSEYPNPSNEMPLMDGVVDPGQMVRYSRGDHRHPSDTSKRNWNDFGVRGSPSLLNSWFVVNSTKLVFTDDKWEGGIYTIFVGAENHYELHANGEFIGFFSLDENYSSDEIEGYAIVGYVDTIAKESQIPAVPTASTDTPQMDSGNGTAGTSDQFARGDHVHPSDTSKLDGAAAYPEWNTLTTYYTGDVVSLDGKLWIEIHSGGHNGIRPGSGGESLDYWRETTVEQLLAAKQDALTEAQLAAANSGATAAKVATWDGYAAQIAQKANATDVNAALAQKANTFDLPYAMVTPGEWGFAPYPDGVTSVEFYGYTSGDGWGISVNGNPPLYVGLDEPNALELEWDVYDDGTCIITATRASLPGHLLDRAVNAVSVSGDTTLTLPALVNAGKARDFLVRLEISGSTVPTITFAAPTGETLTYETDGDEFPVPDEAGTWLYSFTESCVAHKFAVSLKKVQTVAQGGA